MALKESVRSRGELVAALLAGSWRKQPGELKLSPSDLTTITPLLLQSGAGALAWRRLRNSALADLPDVAELQQAYRLHAIQAAVHETNIKDVLKLLRSAEVEPLLVKGWAIACQYPENGLRPYGDIDLCVHPTDYAKAREVLRDAGDRYPVDLHKGTGSLDRHDWDKLFSRSQLLPLDEALVRVLTPEDHFRVLCFHLLRHGVERPIGLCDIAVALEARSSNFNWSMCLGKTQKHAEWIRSVMGLARELLDANLGQLPFPIQEQQPNWIVKTVLKAWGQSFSNHFTQQAPMDFYAHHPRGLVQALAARWPTPIVGTFGVGGSFNRLPRFPYQLGYLVVRSLRFLKQDS